MRTLCCALLFVFAGFVAACTPTGGNTIQDNTPVAATYEGGSITQAEIEAFLSSIPDRQRTRFKTPDGRKDMVERLALNKALTADATIAGFGTTTREKIAMQQAADTYLINRFVQDLRTNSKTEEAARAYYDEHLDEYKKEQVQARHILLKDQSTANATHARITGGEDFQTVAKEVSEDRASKVKGGDLGWFGHGRMAPEFEKAAFAMKPDTTSKPVLTQFGYHVIRVYERKEAGQKSFADVRESIDKLLVSRAKRKRKAELLRELKKGATIVSNLRLPPPSPTAAPPAGGLKAAGAPPQPGGQPSGLKLVPGSAGGTLRLKPSLVKPGQPAGGARIVPMTPAAPAPVAPAPAAPAPAAK